MTSDGLSHQAREREIRAGECLGLPLIALIAFDCLIEWRASARSVPVNASDCLGLPLIASDCLSPWITSDCL